MKILSSLFSLLPLVAFGQQPAFYVEHSWQSDGKGNLICTETHHAPGLHKMADAEAITSKLRVIESTRGSAGGAGNMDLILRATDQLEAFPEALAAFISAAEEWEKIINTPVTLVMDVDYGPERFGSPYSSANVIGSTSSAIYLATTNLNGSGPAVTATGFADTMYARNPGFVDLYYSIPDPIPAETGTVSEIYGTRPNLQAAGFFQKVTPETTPFGQTPNIGFNSAFTFDLDPSNGITSGKTDFQGVAIHEIGHALGFVSSVGWGDPSWISIWDIYRFRPGAVKNLDDFNSAARISTAGPSASGGDHVFWDGLQEFQLSNSNGNGTGGDGRQASHWIDDSFRGALPAAERKIGVMDPTVGAGELLFISVADKRALAVMGWDIEFGNVISPATEYSVYSDYQTPTSIDLSFIGPSSFYGGKELDTWKVVVHRNGSEIFSDNSPQPSKQYSFTDTGLETGMSYTYEVFAVHSSGDTGVVSRKSWVAGGSLVPGEAKSISGSNNASGVRFAVEIPSKHSDGTPLHNLKSYRLYRLPGGIAAEGSLAPSDTGKTLVFLDFPRSKSARNFKYYMTFLGEGSDVESATGPSLTIRLATTLSSWTENFDAPTNKMLADGDWGTANVGFSGDQSFGIRNPSRTGTHDSWSPYLKVAAEKALNFQTIFRVGQGTGYVDISTDFGTNWETVTSFAKTDFPEWEQDQMAWKSQSVNLEQFVNDTVIVRFRLDYNGDGSDYGWLIDNIELGAFTSVTESGNEPTRFTLGQNYPNPFNPETRITYSLPEAGAVRLAVFDILGREVAVLVNKTQPAGTFDAVFSGADLPSGLYFYQLKAGSRTLTKKMTLTR